MRMIQKQLIVIAGAVPAFLTVLLVWRYASRLFVSTRLPPDDAVDRLVFAAHWLLIPGLTLLAGVWVAGRRGFMPDAIDGSRSLSSHGFEINLRYNQNTLEQTVLAAIAWIGLALELPHDQLRLIPAMACLFGFGRLVFWIGYLVHPLGRAFGMVLTMLPTIFAYFWLVSRALGSW